MAAILQCGDEAYGVTIHESVEALSASKSVALGAVYATLDRLEDKELVSSWLSDPTPERGGRSKRYFRLEKGGERALHESALAARRICEVMENAWGAGMDRKVETCPPKVIERVVQLLMPPASREHVLGDLSERYVSPRQYLVDALRTLPFVVVSRVRRTSNPPLDTAVVVMFGFGLSSGGVGNMSGSPLGFRHLSRSAC